MEKKALSSLILDVPLGLNQAAARDLRRVGQSRH